VSKNFTYRAYRVSFHLPENSAKLVKATQLLKYIALYAHAVN